MTGSGTRNDRSVEGTLVESRGNAWTALFAVLLASVVGLHFMTVRPMEQKIDTLEQSMAELRMQLHQRTAWQSNAVAAQTVAMADEAPAPADADGDFDVAEARRQLASIRIFCDELEAESRRTHQALIALDDLATMQHMLIAQQQTIAEAAKTIDDVRQMHEGLATLKRAVLQDAYDTDLAAARVEDLLSMKNQIIWRGGNTASARQNLDGLLMLRDGLGAESVDLTVAGRNLEDLLRMQTKLTSRTRLTPVARVRQNRLATDSLAETAEGLQQLALLAAQQTTIAQAVRAYWPLVELTGIDLAAIDADDLARLIQARRPERVSRRPEGADGAMLREIPGAGLQLPFGPATNRAASAPVPMPTD